MSTVIAIAGKGGTGKTTVAALIIRSLIRLGRVPILAVDADPNANLAESLGVQPKGTIGSVLSDFLRGRSTLPAGMTKQAYLDAILHRILLEGKDVDLLVMGLPEGPGCYCAANAMLRDYFERLAGNYPFVVVDNEAGMEHFSRKTASAIDILILCATCSVKGIRTAAILSGMADDLGIAVNRRGLLLNRAPSRLPARVAEAVDAAGIPLIATLPDDYLIEEAELAGIPIVNLTDASEAASRVDKMVRGLI